MEQRDGKREQDMALTELETLERRIAELERSARSPRRRLRVWLLEALAVLTVAAYASTLTVPNVFTNGTAADAAEVNANFDAVEAFVNASPTEDGTGYVRIGDIQIAFGTMTMTNPGGGSQHVRTFSFTFDAPFSQTPSVSTGINTTSSGFAFVVFNHGLTTTIFNGSALEVDGRQNASVATMSYVAIGPWQ
jgi:hypothetical protein